MSDFHISKYLSELIEAKSTRIANRGESKFVQTFKTYLHSQPLAANLYFLDWSNITGVAKLDLQTATDEDVERFIKSSVIGKYDYIGIIEGSVNPLPLIASISVVIEEFDTLTSRGTNQYLIGLQERGNVLQAVSQDFLECRLDNGHWLIGRQA